MLKNIEDVFIKEEPDNVLVFGNTNTTLAGAQAAAKMHIPLAHVEAGLRCFDRRMPEEMNFLRILYGAKKALTDSGGIQKQAFMLGVPCITLRENTEWAETVEMGWNVLVGADKEKIKKMIDSFSQEGERCGVYGDGKASNKISEILTSFAGKKKGGQT